MKDDQVLYLLHILQQSECKIWFLNIGEASEVEHNTWEFFMEGLKDTKVTHMYATEKTTSLTDWMKNNMLDIILQNQKKHDLWKDPNNADVIKQCTHMWRNPINPLKQKRQSGTDIGNSDIAATNILRGMKHAHTDKASEVSDDPKGNDEDGDKHDKAFEGNYNYMKALHIEFIRINKLIQIYSL